MAFKKSTEVGYIRMSMGKLTGDLVFLGCTGALSRDNAHELVD